MIDLETLEALPLTRLERAFLNALADHAGDDAVSRGALMDALYADRTDGEPDVKIIDVLACKVRKKLEAQPFVIETVWGKGYRLRRAEVLGMAR